jgi:prefoldin subunit 5
VAAVVLTLEEIFVMSESSTPSVTESVTLEELNETIAELEKYRDRLVSDMTQTAQKAKIMKSALMAQLQPELDQIDAAMQALKTQKEALEAQG